MDKTERLMVLAVVVFAVASLGFYLAGVNSEKNTFNKFKSPDQPEATFTDALFSDLRVMTEK